METEVRQRVETMVRTQIEARGIRHAGTLAAMRAVPREEFVPPEVRGEAYGDHALGLGHGQTISQPYVVAFMTEAISPSPGDRVLEVGTGSGYQAAILAAIGCVVDTVETVPELAKVAARRLTAMGYSRVSVRSGDGYNGWPEAAPFDGILVTAATHRAPPPLIDQLKAGGRMVVPIGFSDGAQELTCFEKDGDGNVTTEPLMGVRFVPFQGHTAIDPH